jgi:protein TonB
MTALALYLPAKRLPGLQRWSIAIVLVLATHWALLAGVKWYAQKITPPERTFGVIVSLEPSFTQPEIEQEAIPESVPPPTEMPPPDPVKAEEPPPPPPPEVPAEAPISEPVPAQPIEQIQPPTQLEPPREEKREQKAVGNERYNRLVAEHLGRFNGYLPSMGKARGTVCVKFKLDELGRLQDVYVTRSSGHKLLDQAALDLVRRANPFPAERTRSPEPFDAPIVFAPPRVQLQRVSCPGPL